MKTTRLSLRAFLLLALCTLILGGCASLGGTRVITFSEADMARLLDKRGPFQRRLLEVLDVQVQRPTVRLLPTSNRLTSSFDVSATERVSRTTLTGQLAIEYGLRYDEQAQAVRMTQVKVQNLQLNDVPPEKRAGVRNLGAVIAENLLEDAVIYRFKPSDLKNAEGRGVKPTAVEVTSRGVEITLSPINR
jgi:hypothetical protein